MRRVGIPLLCAGVVFAAPAAARSAPHLAITGGLHAPARALTSHAVALTVTVRNPGPGKASASRLTAWFSQGGPTGARVIVGSARIPALAKGHKARVRITATVPDDAVAVPARVSVCVPPGTPAACATSGAVAIARGSTIDLLGAALAAHRIDLGTYYLDLLKSVRGDPSLPARYRGGGSIAAGAVMARLSADLHTLPVAQQARLIPYLLPPTLKASAWAPRSKGRRKVARAAAEDLSCEKDTPARLTGVWTVLETAHVSVWYLLHNARGKAAAHRVASAVEGQIWPKLTHAFRAPMSDASSPCQGGLNGKPDIFISSSQDALPAVFGNSVVNADGVTSPLPAPFRAGCDSRPDWILLPDTVTRSTVAHEFMHAVQGAYPTCADTRYDEWIEGTAVWAEWFVYPQDQNRAWLYAGWQITLPHLSPLAAGGAPKTENNGGYSWWAFWMSLARAAGGGTSTNPAPIARLLGAVGSSGQTLDALIAAAAGTSMVDAWKRYDVERWNDPPVGQPGSPVRTGFKQWYGIKLRPQDFSVKTKDERLDAKATLFDSDALAIDKVEPAATVYRWLKFPDANVHKIDVHPNTTKAAGAGFVIQAFLKLADGTWRIEDWTSRDDVQLCRDRAAENVQEIVLAYADATTQGAALPNVRGTVQLARTCGLPARLDGTFTRVYTAPSTMGTWKETINGNVSFVRDPTFPLEADQLSSVDYKLAAGTITWSLSGSYDNGTCVHTYGGVGSEAATDATSFGTPTRITLENVVGHPGAPDPEPMPYYYSIREGQDPLKDPEGTDSGCGPTEAQPLILPYFDEGYANPIAPGFPADQVQKSATPKLLSGTRSAPHPDVSGVVFTDSWNFVGSG